VVYSGKWQTFSTCLPGQVNFEFLHPAGRLLVAFSAWHHAWPQPLLSRGTLL